MNASMFRVARATFARELLSYRINRFLHLHIALMSGIGLTALLSPPEAASAAATWWISNGVIYVASLSALLLGLSSAQAEADEFALIFTQPLHLGWWIAGKCAGLLCVAAPSALLLVLPTMLASGGAASLFGAAAAAAGIGVLFAWAGLAVGLRVRDNVRGLIAALALWCALLFGIDILLVCLGGVGWIHDQPMPWVVVLMLSPLDAYRLTTLFVLEGAAFSGASLDPITRWWVENAEAWLSICIAIWSASCIWGAFRGAERRRVG